MTRSGGVPSVQVSVVISTLDRPDSLARCIDALLDGTCTPSEVVVVDQGNAAATAAVLDARRDRGVSLIHVTQPRRGLSASQNAGVERSQHPVVSIVDDDCIPDPRWVEMAATHHGEATSPLLLTGRVLPLPIQGDRTVPLSSRTSTERVVLPRNALPWSIGTGGNFSVTRTAYLQVGGNDERLGTGAPGRAGNDLDVFRRLLRSGIQVRYEPELLVRHERARPSEYRARRWTYGFGVGACAGVWLREGDFSALRVLAAWVRMRARRALRGRRPEVVLDEGRVLLGTIAGLGYGLRIGARKPRASTSVPFPA